MFMIEKGGCERPVESLLVLLPDAVLPAAEAVLRKQVRILLHKWEMSLLEFF